MPSTHVLTEGVPVAAAGLRLIFCVPSLIALTPCESELTEIVAALAADDPPQRAGRPLVHACQPSTVCATGLRVTRKRKRLPWPRLCSALVQYLFE